VRLKIKPVYQVYYNNENNFGIYSCFNLNKDNKKITILGNMPMLEIDSEYTINCIPQEHEKYGLQYKVVSFTSLDFLPPEYEQDFLRILVTDNQFINIIEVYPRPVSAIVNAEFDYNKVHGIGKTTYDLIKKKVEENLYLMDALVKLSEYEITINQIKKIVNYYQSTIEAVKQIINNPYVLYKYVDGIGFKTADKIALSKGMVKDDLKRIEAAVFYCLEQNEAQGSTYMQINDLINQIVNLLQLSYDDIVDKVNKVLANKIDFFYINSKVALRRTFECEKEIAESLIKLDSTLESTLYSSKEELQKEIKKIENSIGIIYTDEQRELFYQLNSHNVILLTGYAGTGKTLLLKGSLKLLKNKGLDYMLMSPTAKAAKVMEQYTGEKASTIHRGLAWTPEGFIYNQFNPLDTDVVIVDEASMMDIFLFRNLLRAIPTGTKLLLIGDPAQLESVATGNVLYDLIASEVFATVKLQTVFRQALDSGILQGATSIRQGQKFYGNAENFFECGVKKDLKIWFSDKDTMMSKLEVLFKECLKDYRVEDIMIISPIKRSNTGIIEINKMIQQICNPPLISKNEIKIGQIIFRENDKVMNVKNDYHAIWLDKDYKEIDDDKGVFNGDIGTIVKIENKNIYVDYGEKIIAYSQSNAYEKLELAYAITCHKSQGSSSPVVIMLLNTSHYMNLKRNLLYTGVTRASQAMYLIADKKALDIALNNNSLLHKDTFLQDLIKNSNYT